MSSEGQVPSDNFLFDPRILSSLPQYEDICSRLSNAGTLKARPLCSDDDSKGYLKVLEELTHVGSIDETKFKTRFNEMKQLNVLQPHYLIVVIEDTEKSRIVAASTLFLELKFIHECAMRGRLEDVAVSSDYRGKKIGEILVSIIVALARDIYKCYKLTLDCSDDLKAFYGKNNFKDGCNMMAIRF